MPRKSLLVLGGIAACTAALLVAGATAESKPVTPPNPPWVRSDGTVDTSYRVPVVDRTGKVVTDATGKPFTVPVAPVLPPAPGQAATVTAAAEAPAPPTTITVDANGA